MILKWKLYHDSHHWLFYGHTKILVVSGSPASMGLISTILVSVQSGRMHNTLRPRQNGRHFADDVFKCIFLNKNVCILLQISLKFVPKGPINNIPSLVQIMAWRRPGDKPLSESMMDSLLTQICVARPQ